MATLRLIRRDENSQKPKPNNRNRSNEYLKRRKNESMYKIEFDETLEPDQNFAWDSWILYPRKNSTATISPRQTLRLQTGWTVLSYPFDEYSLEMRTTEYAARHGIVVLNPLVDDLYGTGGEAELAPIFLNTNSMAIDVHSYDELVLLIMRPKIHFCIDTDARFEEIDKVLQFRVPPPADLKRCERSCVLTVTNRTNKFPTVDHSNEENTTTREEDRAGVESTS